ncbi:Ti-type conjugative transfer relaxase TraA (plasmid) [Ensifer adhaerens]|uniref:Ti-type conjugative transfer relaxase TraA n=1 Tax=Ensifer adhaerens TaxID=106592 RepID=UPI001CBD2091|nr:Ti-type conjugative transfer relaxase TraA [Ensifer adhaerens]MBZ7927127.1 Ti-type conjugative transfer relaxase TraA [Ensifer adhaerens]UAX98168.1 Ti-type conjugative transfer relaxase TraA [Ensifer adhaerens]UAY05550.1 Ti-type conjugative transfer relaxase TraA [Ensifer adhaerens]UAY12928.1 Ti-type conjugative transfer relaxase TraA [Ensifer adhaerens]
MAIYHCSMKPIARSGGRSAVAAIAYRTATKMLNERDGIVHDFTNKRGVEHSEIVLPDDVNGAWALDRSTLWNAVEKAENRKDARVAREFEVALPHEMSARDRLALTRDFARDLANRYGAAADFSIHQPQGESDVRNFHAHVVMTTRVVTERGLGEKTLIERENKWLLNHDQPTSHMQLREIRELWEHQTNRHLARLGLDIRVDHRSHLERGLEIEPTEHMGVHASQMDRRGLDVSRERIDQKAARSNAELIRRQPEQVLAIITGEKSVFDRHDVARALHRYIDDPQGFRNAFASVMASSALVELKPETETELARYSTREMVEIEHTMAAGAERMSQLTRHPVHRRHVERALSVQNDAIRARAAASSSNTSALPGEGRASDRTGTMGHVGLSDEQRLAVLHITGSEQIAAVVGFAGAGKSTMLAAAREAWAAQGYRVHGAALAGKAAEGLEESSGIAARTLASWEYGWQNGKGQLSNNDVLVIDEAGMIGSRQLARFVAQAEVSGAKLVLVGDHEQLQAIGAGSPFRAIVEEVGAVELSEIRRQKEVWQRDASVAFATHRTGQGLSLYAERGAVQLLEDRGEARAALVRDYLADGEARPSGSRIALAHRRIDVRAINADIRAGLQERGSLAKGGKEHDLLGREVAYRTNDGERSFARGDRIVLLENNRDLGVKNGMLGTVIAVEPDALHLRLDGGTRGSNSARAISIPVNSYKSFDHGYATTIHKSQGSTVDRAFVMASRTMDRHLTYVAMTRHRDEVRLYAGADELKDMKTLSLSMGRSGAKETTLDYTGAFAERRGLAERLGVSSEIQIATVQALTSSASSPKAADERERRSEVAAPSSGLSGVERQTVQPLVPAITSYARSVDEIAREKAKPDFDRAMETVRSLGRNVFADPEGAAAKIAVAIVDKGVDGEALAKTVAERPEQFGELRGRAGLLGENKDRKAARQFARALGNLVEAAAETWTRRLKAERDAETWQRENKDVVEVPGLTERSESILKQLDQLPQAQKAQFVEELARNPEGRQALDQAKKIAHTLEQRFGSSDPRTFKKGLERLGLADTTKIERITDVARVVDRAHRAELSRKCELTRGLKKGLGLGM